MTRSEREQLNFAYRQTHFLVQEVPSPFVLRIGQRSRALAILYTEANVHCSAFLTAFNPGSRMLPVRLNRKRQSMLETELRDSGYLVLKGFGKDPTNNWAGEASCLAVGMLRRDALRIGRKYGQLAMVWIGRSTIPRLTWLVY